MFRKLNGKVDFGSNGVLLALRGKKGAHGGWGNKQFVFNLKTIVMCKSPSILLLSFRNEYFQIKDYFPNY